MTWVCEVAKVLRRASAMISCSSAINRRACWARSLASWAWAERAVDGRLDQVVVGVVGDAVVVFAGEAAAQDDEAGTHVVVAVRHDRAALLHREDLLAEDQPLRQPLHLAEVDAQVRRAAG